MCWEQLCLQTPKETCARSNFNFPRADQYVHVYSYSYTYMGTDTHTGTCKYTHKSRHTHTHIWLMYTYPHTHTHTYTQIHTQSLSHIHTHTGTHTHTHTHSRWTWALRQTCSFFLFEIFFDLMPGACMKTAPHSCVNISYVFETHTRSTVKNSITYLTSALRSSETLSLAVLSLSSPFWWWLTSSVAARVVPRSCWLWSACCVCHTQFIRWS